MKKLIIIIIGAFTLLFGVNVKGSTFYTLDTPIEELNNHTLREVFENRNIAIPDLTDKTQISDGVYRLYDNNGVTFDYNVYSGVFTLNGTATSFTQIIRLYLNDNYRYTLSYIYENGIISGRLSLGFYQGSRGGYGGIAITDYNYTSNSNDVTEIGVDNFRIYAYNEVIYNNFTFKLQIERGTIATPYQEPTNGPYNDFDISTLGLTTEQIDYWFSVYQDLLKDIERVSQLPNLFIDLFNELTDNFVLGFKGFTQLIYLPGYGLTDLGIISLIVIAISVIGIGFYIIRKVIK